MKKVFPFLFVAAIPVGAALFLVADNQQQKSLPTETSISVSQEHTYSAINKDSPAAKLNSKSGKAQANDAKMRIGQVAPQMQMVALDGSEQTLAPRGELSLVMLADTTCPCVRAYDGRMKALAKQFPSLKITYVFPSPLESRQQVQKFATAHGYKWPVVYDASQKLFKAVDGKCTTESFLFDTSGTLRYHGRIDDNIYDESNVKSRELETAVRAVIAGKSIEKTEVAAFGCVIPHAEK